MYAHPFPLLVGDVGATKTLLAVASVGPQGVELHRPTVARFESTAYPHLRDLVASYVATHPGLRPRGACFGVPGPVIEGSCRTTNLPWQLHDQELAATLTMERVLLVNDVAALAWALARLPLPAHRVLCPGSPISGAAKLVVAVGTGLGSATLLETPYGPAVVASEAGHCDFSPKSREDWELAAHLRSQVGTVSYEHVVSGPGLVRLYRFLAREGADPALATATDPAAWVVTGAENNACCARTVSLAVRYLARFLSDLFLVTLPLSGVFLAGSVAAGLAPWLRSAEFSQEFQGKAAHQDLLAQVPVYLLEDPLAPLLGCAYAWLASEEKFIPGQQ